MEVIHYMQGQKSKRKNNRDLGRFCNLMPPYCLMVGEKYIMSLREENNFRKDTFNSFEYDIYYSVLKGII